MPVRRCWQLEKRALFRELDRLSIMVPMAAELTLNFICRGPGREVGPMSVLAVTLITRLLQP